MPCRPGSSRSAAPPSNPSPVDRSRSCSTGSRSPEPDEHTHLADVVPLFFLPGATPVAVPPGPLAAAAAALLDGAPQQSGAGGQEPAAWWRAGPLGVLVRVTQGHGALSTDLAVVIDDRAEALTEPGYDDAWRNGCGSATPSALRTGPMSITTVSQALATTGTAAGTLVETEPAAARTPVGETAREAADLPPRMAQTGGERLLGGRGGPAHRSWPQTGRAPVPVVGDEVEGIVVDLAWPAYRIAVFVTPDPDTRRELEAAGWRVLGPDLEPLLAALAAATPSTEGP